VAVPELDAGEGLDKYSKIAKLLNMTEVGRVFRALADPTRRQILQELKDGELAAGVIAARFDISGPSVSRHLAILKAAELITERRDGNRILYALLPEQLTLCLNDFLSGVCPTQIVKRRRIASRRRTS
jgi:DNA-binding transcriptional ArsR family regulator